MLLYLLASLVLASTTDGASVKFFKNYHATGYVSLPYAEIKEPFEAWYSSSLNKSRIGNITIDLLWVGGLFEMLGHLMTSLSRCKAFIFELNLMILIT